MIDLIKFVQKGNFKKTNSFLQRCLERFNLSDLDKYGKLGVNALSSATPKESGETANSWYYTIERERNSIKITWCNSNIVDGCNIAVILQYGHGTRNGGYVEGVDYINPAMRPVFDKMASNAWREVIK